MSGQVKLADLSEAQRKMLRAAAARPRTSNCAPVGKGQAATAKKLETLGLGHYISNGLLAWFWISEKGYEVASQPPASTEGSE